MLVNRISSLLVWLCTLDLRADLTEVISGFLAKGFFSRYECPLLLHIVQQVICFMSLWYQESLLLLLFPLSPSAPLSWYPSVRLPSVLW